MIECLDSMSAHPRSRGEHIRSFFGAESKGGSSPLARGTHGGFHSVIVPRRLIPARAGNTQVALDTNELDAAHPRSRGEHREAGQRVNNARGSSPLARGTHHGHHP